MVGAVLLMAGVGILSSGAMGQKSQMGQMGSSGQMGQMGPQSPTPRPGMPSTDGRGKDEGLPPELIERQAKSQNMDRQKRLVDDTNKLLALATDLKQQVDKTNKDVLSVDVIKKADEIEKLARSVKERMKG
jgi:hypothetical protein